MENLQSYLNTLRSSPKVSLLSPSVAGGGRSCNAVVQAAKDIKMTLEEQLVLNLCNPELRGNALAELSKVDDVEVTNFLLRTDVVPMCLQIMEMGSELSKIVSTFIIEKILLDDAGLTYICASVDRFFNVSNVLATMVAALFNEPSTKILKHVICCYLRLTYHPRALVALRISFPEALKDGTFDNCLREDSEAVQRLQQLLDRLKNGGAEGASLPGPDPAEGGNAGGGAPPPVPGDAAGPSRGGAFVANKIWKWVE